MNTPNPYTLSSAQINALEVLAFDEFTCPYDEDKMTTEERLKALYEADENDDDMPECICPAELYEYDSPHLLLKRILSFARTLHTYYYPQLKAILEDSPESHPIDVNDTVNNHPQTQQAIRCAIADLEGILPEYDPDGERSHPAWQTLKELKRCIQ